MRITPEYLALRPLVEKILKAQKKSLDKIDDVLFALADKDVVEKFEARCAKAKRPIPAVTKQAYFEKNIEAVILYLTLTAKKVPSGKAAPAIKALAEKAVKSLRGKKAS